MEDKFNEVKNAIISKLSNLEYTDGDLGDIGNEIGFVLGKYLTKDEAYTKEQFINGLEHGIDLKNNVKV